MCCIRGFYMYWGYYNPPTSVFLNIVTYILGHSKTSYSPSIDPNPLYD